MLFIDDSVCEDATLYQIKESMHANDNTSSSLSNFANANEISHNIKNRTFSTFNNVFRDASVENREKSIKFSIFLVQIITHYMHVKLIIIFIIITHALRVNGK